MLKINGNQLFILHYPDSLGQQDVDQSGVALVSWRF